MRIAPINNISNISFLNNKKNIKEVTGEVTNSGEGEQINMQWRKLINVPPIPPLTSDLQGESNNGKEEGLGWK